jgi:hypothetical protein
MNEDKQRILLKTLESIDDGLTVRQALMVVLDHVKCGQMEASAIEHHFNKILLKKHDDELCRDFQLATVY